MSNQQTVAILGASSDLNRYSYKAFQLLKEFGHNVLLISPKLESLEGYPVYASLNLAPQADTLTMYVGPAVSSKMTEEILRYRPRRIIFNPGSENIELQETLSAAGIKVEEACTLVLLKTHQF